MKKAYTAPELEAVRLTMRDVILSSPVVPEDEIGASADPLTPRPDISGTAIH